ncbi:MAG TPA: ribonuclease H-like domain-containing protein [Candidatus Pelethenecus sp.]|nr:ribonuclease H-like domain-containing protein [Candidatus Pelethenecus sp.]
MITFAWKWLGEKQTHVLGLPDFPVYKKSRTDDSQLVKALWKLFDEADIIIAHNGNSFDIKKANSRFMKHHLLPPSPYKTIDTKLVAKRYFKQDSNKLDDLGDYFGIGRKINTGGFELWLGCEAGDKKAWNKMKEYNKQDVILLERVYLAMLPYMSNHPNVSTFSGEVCPKCGGNHLQSRGYARTISSVYKRFQCQSCGGWGRFPTSEDKITSLRNI